MNIWDEKENIIDFKKKHTKQTNLNYTNPF